MATSDPSASGRVVPAFFAHRRIEPDEPFETALAAHLRGRCTAAEIAAFFDHYTMAHGDLAARLRRTAFRALLGRLGDGAEVGLGVTLRHPATFTVGAGVFFGDHAVLQGRHDGRCVIGDRTWIGPQTFLDARDLEIGDLVGIGPGVRVVGSRHSGEPAAEAVIATDLEILPVRIESGADLGAGAVVLPGVTIGRGAIVGAGAVVTGDVEPHTVVAGVPARVLRRRS